MKSPPFVVGDYVLVASGPYAGEGGPVVAIDGDRVDVNVLMFGENTRMAFDASVLSLQSADPRPAFRAELEKAYERAAAKDMLRWYSEVKHDGNLLALARRARAYADRQPIRATYERILVELEEEMDDQVVAEDGPDALAMQWATKKISWLTQLGVEEIDEEAKQRARELMAAVHRAESATEDDEVN